MGSRVRENDGDGECGSVMVTNLSAVRVCRVASFLETKNTQLSPEAFLVCLSLSSFSCHPRAGGDPS